MEPLQRLATVNLTEGTGMLFMSTLVVQSGNLNFLEGCYHAYSPATAPYPGVLMSTVRATALRVQCGE